MTPKKLTPNEQLLHRVLGWIPRCRWCGKPGPESSSITSPDELGYLVCDNCWPPNQTYAAASSHFIATHPNRKRRPPR